VRDVIDVDGDSGEFLSSRSRNLIDDQQWRRRAGMIVEELGHRAPGGSGGEQKGGLGVGQRGLQPLSVTGQFRGEQRHRNGPRLHRREETRDVVQPLRRQDRDPLPRAGRPLNPGADRAQPHVQL